jgi:hypothetical protein
METLLKNVLVIKGNIMNYTQREWDRVVGIGNPPEDELHKPEKLEDTSTTENTINPDEEAELLKKLRVIRGI